MHIMTPLKEALMTELSHIHLPQDDEEVRTAEIVRAFGLRQDTPGTRDTPKRFVRAMFDATEGYEGDPKLLTAFPTECKGGANCELAQVVEGPIPFVGVCEHHVLPFVGRAW